MQKKVILLSLIDNKIKATPVSKEVLEAVVFLSIRHGVKNMMIVNAQTNELLCGEQEYAAANDRGDTEAEVMSCDPESPAITSLALLNNRSEGDIPKEYGFEDNDVFEEDKGHSEHFPQEDDAEFEGTSESYKKYGRIKPVYYVEFEREGKIVKAVVDGWKYVCFAKANGIKKVYACKLCLGNNDDLLSIMLQLQRSNHDSCAALFAMIMALWPKYYKGPGFRSDMTDQQLSDITTEHDGKRLNIYQKIGRELNLSGNRVKHLRKIGLVCPLFFERIDVDRSSLYQAYLKCVDMEKGVMPEAPSVKMPTYFTNTTPVPQFSEPTTTDDNNPSYNQDVNTAPVDSTEDIDTDDNHEQHASSNSTEETYSTPVSNTVVIGTVLPVSDPADDFIMVKAVGPYCHKEIFIKIYKTQLQ